MGTAKATRAADKSQVCRRLVQALQKLYGKSVPQIQLPVLETMLFAVCLEDSRWDQAEAGLKRLIASFFDLNEIRVSSGPCCGMSLRGRMPSNSRSCDG
jgi:endonuclease-3